MFSGKMDELFKLLKSPLVTPFNLLENITLNNYVSIKYYKDNDSILADIVFLSYNEEITYRYVFDKNYFLQEIYEVDDGKLIKRFSREDNKNRLHSQIKEEIYEDCLKEG